MLSELARGDVLAVMPTGSGKSMCYVLPALAEGRVLVVSPLIALMQDQVESLAAAGVLAGFINSSLDRAAQNRAYVDFLEGRLKLLYVAPERFTNARFVDGLRGAGVRLLAIDEAHCMSEWGHDFRPDYLTLGSVRERLGLEKGELTKELRGHVKEVVTAALTHMDDLAGPPAKKAMTE